MPPAAGRSIRPSWPPVPAWTAVAAARCWCAGRRRRRSRIRTRSSAIPSTPRSAISARSALGRCGATGWWRARTPLLSGRRATRHGRRPRRSACGRSRPWPRRVGKGSGLPWRSAARCWWRGRVRRSRAAACGSCIRRRAALRFPSTPRRHRSFPSRGRAGCGSSVRYGDRTRIRRAPAGRCPEPRLPAIRARCPSRQARRRSSPAAAGAAATTDACSPPTDRPRPAAAGPASGHARPRHRQPRPPAPGRQRPRREAP